MKICLIAPGNSIHTIKWVNYFAQKGYDVHLIYFDFIDGYDKRIEIHKLIKILPQMWKISRFVSGLLWIFQINWIVKKINPEILDVHYVTINSYFGALTGHHPFIITPWGSDVLHDLDNPFLRFASIYALNKSDLIFYNSDRQFNILRDAGIPSKKMVKIRNGVDVKKFSPESRDSNIRKSLEIPDNANVVVSTRYFFPIYNLEMLVKSIPSVLSQRPDTYFLLIGDGEEKTKLIELCKALNVISNVRLIGTVNNDALPLFLNASDLYVSTSLSDSSPVSLQESMACGLVPIVTDLPANREFITNGTNGWLIPVNNVEELSSKIVFMLNDDKLRRDMGKKNRCFIVDHSNYYKEMEKVEKSYLDQL
ncbi:MAG: glycosyltransferase family 4 protein [Candidatus Doudnabacteria bacterium]